MSPGTQISELHLVCHPNKIGNKLIFPYTVENLGPIDAYVMDATPGFDPTNRIACANDQAVVVIQGADGNVIVGKFIAPLPIDRRVAIPVIPLARKLPMGKRLERSFEIPVPLAEASPYYSDLPLRKYEIVEILGVIITIGYWLSGVDGLVATPVDYAPELFLIATRHTMSSSVLLTQRFPTKGLQLFRRLDLFHREIKGITPTNRHCQVDAPVERS